jgi:hypothetical protein
MSGLKTAIGKTSFTFVILKSEEKNKWYLIT